MAGSLNYGYVNAFMETVSSVTAQPSVELGCRRVDNNKEYVYVYNAGEQDATVGHGMVASLNSAFSVSLSSTVGDQLFGVCQSTAIPAGEYGWLQTRGVCLTVHGTSDGTRIGEMDTSAGQPLVLGDMGTFFGITTGATQSTWKICCGTALEAIVSGSSGQAYINANR